MSTQKHRKFDLVKFNQVKKGGKMVKLLLVLLVLALAFPTAPAQSREQTASGDYTDTGDGMTGFEEYLATDDDDED
jgi:hypothetical protein